MVSVVGWGGGLGNPLLLTRRDPRSLTGVSGVRGDGQSCHLHFRMHEAETLEVQSCKAEGTNSNNTRRLDNLNSFAGPRVTPVPPFAWGTITRRDHMGFSDRTFLPVHICGVFNFSFLCRPLPLALVLMTPMVCTWLFLRLLYLLSPKTTGVFWHQIYFKICLNCKAFVTTYVLINCKSYDNTFVRIVYMCLKHCIWSMN